MFQQCVIYLDTNLEKLGLVSDHIPSEARIHGFAVNHSTYI